MIYKDTGGPLSLNLKMKRSVVVGSTTVPGFGWVAGGPFLRFGLDFGMTPLSSIAASGRGFQQAVLREALNFFLSTTRQTSDRIRQ